MRIPILYSIRKYIKRLLGKPSYILKRYEDYIVLGRERESKHMHS
jgi:hypothetical protein